MKTPIVSYFLNVYKDFDVDLTQINANMPSHSKRRGGKPVRSYIIHTYSDGTTDIVAVGNAPAEDGEATGDEASGAHSMTGCSARMYQILLVLQYIRDNRDRHLDRDNTPNAEAALRCGIGYAVEKCGLPRSTVSDKIFRQLGVNAGFWREKVRIWLCEGDFSPIENFLWEKLDTFRNDSSKDKDKEALRAFVESLQR